MMKIGEPEFPTLDAPIVVESHGWWIVWHGGEYMNIFASEAGARRDERNENPHPDYAVADINTVGDEFDPEDPEQYVKDELRAWVRTDAQYY